jgi:DNA-binding response OmpR family regulator
MYLKPLRLPKACILVLEDDPNRRSGLCRMLAESGFHPAESANAAAGDRIDLVLASIEAHRPRYAGPAPHRLDVSIPVIALVDHAAWTGFDFFDAANELGAAAVLQRPFSRTSLLRLIATVLSAPVPGVEAAGMAENRSGLADLLYAQENANPA